MPKVYAKKWKRDPSTDEVITELDRFGLDQPVYEIREVDVNEETYDIMKMDNLNLYKTIEALKIRIEQLESILGVNKHVKHN